MTQAGKVTLIAVPAISKAIQIPVATHPIGTIKIDNPFVRVALVDSVDPLPNKSLAT